MPSANGHAPEMVNGNPDNGALGRLPPWVVDRMADVMLTHFDFGEAPLARAGLFQVTICTAAPVISDVAVSQIMLCLKRLVENVYESFNAICWIWATLTYLCDLLEKDHKQVVA